MTDSKFTGIEFRSHVMPISTGMLKDYGFVKPTPEERERWRRRAAEADQERRARLLRHDQLIATATGLQRAVLELHAPVPGAREVCEGCDIDGYEAEPPEWPCRTWALAADGAPSWKAS